MGVSKGSQALYSLIGLTRGDVADIAHGIARDRGVEHPIIDVDCSNVCFKVGKTVHGLAAFLLKWAQAGLHVVPICDGRVRPVAKQATNKRFADREKKRIQACIIQKQLRDLRSRLYSDADKQAIMDKIKAKEREYKSAETAASNAIPSDLDDKLSAELSHRQAHTKNASRGFVDKVITAEFQADALLMGRSTNGEALIIQSSDADIPIIAGDECLALKEFTLDGKMELVSTCRATLENAMQYLTDDAKERAKLRDALHPIFEGVTDRKLRALMTLYLGCDVLAKGMPNVGPKTLEDIINVKYKKFSENHKNTSLFAYLKRRFYRTMPGFDNDVLHTYIRALVYEPTNTAPDISWDDTQV